MNTQRILHVVGRMDRAGAETMLMNLYREIDRTKFQFDFVYFTSQICDYDDEIIALGGQIIRINSSNPVNRFFYLLNILRKGEWRVVQAHTLFSSGLHLLAAKFAKIPMRVAHSHSTNDENSGSAMGRIYQYCMRMLISNVSTSYIACGKAAAEYLFPSETDVKIIPNAIDIEKFVSAQGSKVRAELALKNDQLIILQVGRFMPVKNHSYSVRIAEVLRDKNIDFKMLFVGAGPEIDTVKADVCLCNLRDSVRFLGLRSDIAELMAASDVMLMPSLHEGFPVVLVESQAVGLPAIIASTITPEVNLGLGLVSFMELEAGPGEWALKIKDKVGGKVASKESRLKTLDAKGFSASSGAKRLITIYNKL